MVHIVLPLPCTVCRTSGVPELLASRLLPEQVEQDAGWRAGMLPPGGSLGPGSDVELFRRVREQVRGGGGAAAGCGSTHIEWFLRKARLLRASMLYELVA